MPSIFLPVPQALPGGAGPRLARGLVLAAALLAPQFAAAQQGGQMPPTAVGVITLAPEPLPLVNDLPGRISATRSAEVRPRVTGIVKERVFEQGGIVNEGDVLYRIDPAAFRVQVAQAQATLAGAQASEQQARNNLARQESLRQRNVTSGVDLEDAQTTLATAVASVQAAQAALEAAQLNLDWTEVRAPISGTIGRALVTEGALVTANTDEMALIQQFDPVYADFTQSSQQLRDLRRALNSGQLVATAPNEAMAEMYYDDGEKYPHPGKLLFSEAAVDATTGQVTLRAEFPNPEGELLPGLYIRIRIAQATRQDALAVPQMAVSRDPQGNARVYVVKADDTVEMKPVTLGITLDSSRWLVNSGLAAGDVVVVEGSQKLFPGAKVNPSPWSPATADAAAPADAPKAN